MMCNCCNGAHSCTCWHHKLPMLGGIGLVALGVVLFLTTYGWLDEGVWQWLLPLALVLGGLHCCVKRGCSCCKPKGEVKQ